MIAKILCLLIVGCTLANAAPNNLQNQEEQYNNLLKELRYLVCQNQDLSDSSATLAEDLRKQVRSLVQAGQSNAAIKTYLRSRYGDFILFKPPLRETTALLWFGPFLFLALGLLVLWRLLRKRVVL